VVVWLALGSSLLTGECLQVLDPNMDLRTVKHFIWKQGGTDLTLHYRLIGTKWLFRRQHLLLHILYCFYDLMNHFSPTLLLSESLPKCSLTKQCYGKGNGKGLYLYLWTLAMVLLTWVTNSTYSLSSSSKLTWADCPAVRCATIHYVCRQSVG